MALPTAASQLTPVLGRAAAVTVCAPEGVTETSSAVAAPGTASAVAASAGVPCAGVPGVLSDPECYENESHWNGALEAPQYSRPEVWHERAVPPILLSGNHAKVDQWRRKQSILRTRRRRPDLYERLDLSSKADQKILKELRAEEPELFPED